MRLRCSNDVQSDQHCTTGRVNKPITVVIVKLGSNIADSTDEISSPLSSE